MDNSQNVFSKGTNSKCSPANMAIDIYESLLSKTKTQLCQGLEPSFQSTRFSEHITTVLEEVGSCISTALDLVLSLLEESQLNFRKVVQCIDGTVCVLQMLLNFLKITIESVAMSCYSMRNVPTTMGRIILVVFSHCKDSKVVQCIDGTVCVLQMLLNFLKITIESVAMSCYSMRNVPTTMGRIILVVFLHCKDSETIYGGLLNNVEKQLKDLFRACHELQLTYLMILEKHFVFDLSETEEVDILIEVLEINLKIGETVQGLDVKTMAEQWKAYTVICEKYSKYLTDTNICNKCTKFLCAVIVDNMNTALETNQEERLVLRSLKVTSFAIKILTRLCNIFKENVVKKYECVLDLLIYIYLHNNAYLSLERSPKFVNLIVANVFNTAEGFLEELLQDDTFCKCLLEFELDSLKIDDKMLGYIIALILSMNFLSRKINKSVMKKDKLINAVIRIIPYGYVWFNMPLKFSSYTKAAHVQTYGLYDHLLVHTAVFASTLNSKEYETLEHAMYESLLGTESCKALFAADLWTMLNRIISNDTLPFNQLLTLCKIYQQLENNNQFRYSPQRTHLNYIIGKMIQFMSDEGKTRLFQHIDIFDKVNTEVWTCLKISNLPGIIRSNIQEVIVEDCKIHIQKLITSNIRTSEDVYDLVKTIKLAATCSFTDQDITLYVVKAWTKSCLKSNCFIVSQELEGGMLWYLDFIESLVSITDSIIHNFQNENRNKVKVLHTIFSMLETGNIELSLILIDLLCKMSSLQVNDESEHFSETILINAFKYLFKHTNEMVKKKFLISLKKYFKQRNTHSVLEKVFSDISYKIIWDDFVRNEHATSITEWKEKMYLTMDYSYVHKCIESNHSEFINIERKSSRNFEFADLDTLFDAGSDSEPDCKKVKLDGDEANIIICRLEKDVELLCNVKENVFTDDYKNRITDLCSKLKNIPN